MKSQNDLKQSTEEMIQPAEDLLHPRVTKESLETEQDPTQVELKTYPMAWGALALVVLFRTAVAIFGNTFSPIPTIVAEYLHVSLSEINWLYTIMSMVYILVSFGTSWLYETIGVKWSLLASGVFLSAGCWIRWIAVRFNPPSFTLVMIGQAIASVSIPISLNIMTVFSSLWFTEDKRATASVFIASNYGSIISMFLIPVVATSVDKMESTIIMVASLCTACTIPFIFMPSKPKTPASLPPAKMIDPNSGKEIKTSLIQGTLALLRNPQFLIILFVHGINVGLSIAWGGLMNQAISPYGYSNADAGNIAAIGIVGGSIGCFIAGPILDRTKQHKILLKMVSPIIFSTYLAFIFIIKTEAFAAILYVNFLNQFFLSFLVPVCVELGVETSYPVTDSIPTSLLWQLGQVVGSPLVIVMDRFRDPQGTPKNNMVMALVFQAGLASVMMLLSLVFNGPMARTEAFAQIKKNQEEKALPFETYSHLVCPDNESSETIMAEGRLTSKRNQ